MDDEKVIAKLAGLEEREFRNLAKVGGFGHPEARLKLLELGFSAEDERRMARFRELYDRAKGERAAKIIRERTERAERSRGALAARIKELNGKIAVISPTKNAVVRGTTLTWTCPECGQKQEIDLTKASHEKGYLRIDGKAVPTGRRGGAADPTRRALMAKGPDDLKLLEGAKFAAASAAPRSGSAVAMGSGPDSPAVNRLRGGSIVFGFRCMNRKCGFSQGNVEVGVA